jgi:hypothetical protein
MKTTMTYGSEAHDRFARTTLRRSRTHLATTVLLYGGIAIWFASVHASAGYFAFLVAAGLFIALYNLRRMRSARLALANPERLSSFAADQRRSHRLRGTIYLAVTPPLLGATWYGAVTTSGMTTSSWVMLTGATLFLAWGGVFWARALLTLRRSGVD